MKLIVINVGSKRCILKYIIYLQSKRISAWIYLKHGEFSDTWKVNILWISAWTFHGCIISLRCWLIKTLSFLMLKNKPFFRLVSRPWIWAHVSSHVQFRVHNLLRTENIGEPVTILLCHLFWLTLRCIHFCLWQNENFLYRSLRTAGFFLTRYRVKCNPVAKYLLTNSVPG